MRRRRLVQIIVIPLTLLGVAAGVVLLVLRPSPRGRSARAPETRPLPHPEEPATVAEAHRRVLDERPGSIKDRKGVERLRTNLGELRRLAKEDPDEAFRTLETQPAYAVEIVEGILSSGDPEVIERLRRLIRRDDISVKARSWMIGGIRLGNLKGEMYELSLIHI